MFLVILGYYEVLNTRIDYSKKIMEQTIKPQTHQVNFS